MFEAGQLVGGLYTVVSGALESRVPQNAGEDFVRIIGQGEHWGERVITGGLKTLGILTALEDTELMVLRRDEFELLNRSLPFFR